MQVQVIATKPTDAARSAQTAAVAALLARFAWAADASGQRPPYAVQAQAPKPQGSEIVKYMRAFQLVPEVPCA